MNDDEHGMDCQTDTDWPEWAEDRIFSDIVIKVPWKWRLKLLLHGVLAIRFSAFVRGMPVEQAEGGWDFFVSGWPNLKPETLKTLREHEGEAANNGRAG